MVNEPEIKTTETTADEISDTEQPKVKRTRKTKKEDVKPVLAETGNDDVTASNENVSESSANSEIVSVNSVAETTSDTNAMNDVPVAEAEPVKNVNPKALESEIKSENAVVEQPVKRKRGRPRKVIAEPKQAEKPKAVIETETEKQPELQEVPLSEQNEEQPVLLPAENETAVSNSEADTVPDTNPEKEEQLFNDNGVGENESHAESEPKPEAVEKNVTEEHGKYKYEIPKAISTEPCYEDNVHKSVMDKYVSLKDVLLMAFVYTMLAMLISGMMVKNETDKLNKRIDEQATEIETLRSEVVQLHSEIDAVASSIPEPSESQDAFGDFFGDIGDFFSYWGNNVPYNNGGVSEMPEYRNREDHEAEKRDANENVRETEKGYIGVQVAETDNGVVVVTVLRDDSERSIHAGDIITRVDNTEIETVSDITKALTDKNVGDSVFVTLMRDDSEVTVSIVLVTSPETRYVPPVPADMAGNL